MVVPPRWGARVGYRQYYDPILSIKDGVFSLVLHRIRAQGIDAC